METKVQFGVAARKTRQAPLPLGRGAQAGVRAALGFADNGIRS